MEKIVAEFYENQSVGSYERSHGPRFQHLVEDLRLNEIKNSRIGDFGCGYGPLFRRLPNGQGNTFFGFDGADLPRNPLFKYSKVDLNLAFAKDFLVEEKQLDIAFCFETMEHLTNPYSALTEIKMVLKSDGVLYLSIPHQDITHNTIYPGLLYPVENFTQFLEQMAFEIVDLRVHDKAFKQNVYTLINKGWDRSKLKWEKHEDKFHGIPPVVAVNL